MKTIHKQKGKFVLRFDAGEDVMDGLKNFGIAQKIKSAGFSAIGACGEVVLSFYNLKTKKYLDKNFAKNLEIVGLTGNLAWLGKEIIVHAHGLFSDKKMNVVGGHVKKLVVSATCEVIISVMDKKIIRRYDEKTGLNLMK
jgi:predicted DNA-binding protein with PD1-like motif